MIRAPHSSPSLQWRVVNPGAYQMCGQTYSVLPSGAYSCEVDGCGETFFQRRDLQVDDLIDFSDSLSSQILSEIDRFWTIGHRFQRLGFLHCRGYLLYGKQGGGKSSLIHQVIAKMMQSGNVAFFCGHPYYFVRAVEKFRQVEPERPIVCVFEDIDTIIEQYGDGELLQWLDGNHHVNKAVNIATTNYPEKLDARIVARPRRFDRVLRIESPSARHREAYFTRKLPDQAPAERQTWVEASEGLSFAALAELVISVYCLENTLEETVRRLRAQDLKTASSEEYSSEAAADEWVFDTVF